MNPYAKVGEASNCCAFIEWPDGFDKIAVHRVYPDEVQDPDHKAACLSDEDWQETVSLIAVAPQLLELLKAMVAGYEAGCLEPEFIAFPVAAQRAKELIRLVDPDGHKRTKNER